MFFDNIPSSAFGNIKSSNFLFSSENDKRTDLEPSPVILKPNFSKTTIDFLTR